MNCQIIKDLLPLYHDEVVSEESRAVVEEHLKTCAECQEMLEGIHKSIKMKNAPEKEQPLAGGMKLLKKKLRRKTLKIAVFTVCVIAAISALTYGMFFYEAPAPYSEVARNITQPINSAADLITNVRGYKSMSLFMMGDTLYICCSDTFWSRCIAKNSKRLQQLQVLEIPTSPTAPTAPVAPGSTAQFSEPPLAPEPPNPHIELNKATKIYYYEGNISKLAGNDAAFSAAIANAVLIWEKP